MATKGGHQVMAKDPMAHLVQWAKNANSFYFHQKDQSNCEKISYLQMDYNKHI